MGKHVLVIDDNRLALANISDILTNAGYKVSTAQDVVYCNNLIYCKSPPDLILIDLNLPFMNGDHKTRLIKQRPKSSHIPVVLISSIAASELSAIAADCGADGFLAKPFSADELTGTIEQYLVQ